MRAEQTSPLFLTLRVCVSCRARDVELCCLWALSERDCDRMEVLTTIPPGIVFEGFLKIALSRPAWFSWLHSRRPRRTLTRADLRCSELPRSHSETGQSSVSRRLQGRARGEVVFQASRAINLSRRRSSASGSRSSLRRHVRCGWVPATLSLQSGGQRAVCPATAPGWRRAADRDGASWHFTRRPHSKWRALPLRRSSERSAGVGRSLPRRAGGVE